MVRLQLCCGESSNTTRNEIHRITHRCRCNRRLIKDLFSNPRRMFVAWHQEKTPDKDSGNQVSSSLIIDPLQGGSPNDFLWINQPIMLEELYTNRKEPTVSGDRPCMVALQHGFPPGVFRYCHLVIYCLVERNNGCLALSKSIPMTYEY